LHLRKSIIKTGYELKVVESENYEYKYTGYYERMEELQFASEILQRELNLKLMEDNYNFGYKTRELEIKKIIQTLHDSVLGLCRELCS